MSYFVYFNLNGVVDFITSFYLYFLKYVFYQFYEKYKKIVMLDRRNFILCTN